MGFIKRRTAVLIISFFTAGAIAAAAVVYKISYTVKGSPVTRNIVFNDAAVWQNDYDLKFKNHNYIITETAVSDKDIDKKLQETCCEENGDNFEVYTIKNVFNYRQLAVKTRYGYLIANKVNSK